MDKQMLTEEEWRTKIRQWMTDEVAALVVRLRTEQDYTWRALAREVVQRYGFGETGQVFGTALCYEAWAAQGREYNYFEE